MRRCADNLYGSLSHSEGMGEALTLGSSPQQATLKQYWIPDQNERRDVVSCETLSVSS